ncbi:MAG: hypothetical protein L3K16_05400 [Thermoplasmata archaeon]|nr:hypothetical protein [Thermoplasmata archaeon]
MARRTTTIRRLRPFVQAIAVVAVVVAVTVVVVTLAPNYVGSSGTTVDGFLSVGPVVAEPPATFWAVGTHVQGFQNTTLSSDLNDTPISYFRWGAGGDAQNQTTGVSYSANGTESGLGSSDPAFVQFCRARGCQAILTVPGEIDDPGAAAVTVRYVEQVLGFHPAFWSIGNEPQLWTHFGIPWTDWRWTDASTPTPEEYAVEVQHYIAAMRSVDTAIRIIGIQSDIGGPLGAAWMGDVVARNGPNLSAVAYHSYPAGVPPLGSGVVQFLATGLTHGFPEDYRATEATVDAACPRCDIPVFVDEYNGDDNGYYAAEIESYPDVPLVAAAVVRGLQENASQFSFFDLEDTSSLTSFGLLDGNGNPRPTFYLYSEFFRNLSIGAIDNTTILGGGSYMFAVVGHTAGATSLFVVNANVSDSLRLSLNGSGFPIGSGGTVYQWAPGERLPLITGWGARSLASSWAIPPEGILLIDVPT